jgi:hypothetical protein
MSEAERLKEAILVVAEGCPYCVPPGTIISGDFKPIQDIKIGDKALGLAGHTSITQLFHRTYAGDMFIIKACGLLPIALTPEHPVLIAEGVEKYKPHRIDFETWKWKLPHEIREKHEHKDGDYLVIPKPPKEIDLARLDLSLYTTTHGIKTAHGLHVPLSFPLTSDTAWLLGLYVAEGCSAGRRGVCFTLGKHEVNLVKKVLACAKEIGYSPNVFETSTALRITIQSRLLSRAFSDWCGNRAENKRVPSFIMFHKNDDIVEAFLTGYLDGDGSICNKKYYRAVTTSKVLALQLQLLSTRLDISACIYEQKGSTNVQGRKVNAKPQFTIIFFDKRPRKRIKILNDYMFTPVLKVTKVNYKGEVFNIATDHNVYCVSNAVVHNCEEMKKRLPKDKIKILDVTKDIRAAAILRDLGVYKVPVLVTVEKTEQGTELCSLDDKSLQVKCVKASPEATSEQTS